MSPINYPAYKECFKKYIWVYPTIIALFMFYLHLDKGLLKYDEADYVTAARKGFVTNYWDVHSTPFHEFIQKGTEIYILKKHTSLAKEIRNQEDICFFRHFHAPLLFYILSISSRLFGNHDMIFRIVYWLITVLIVPVTYWCIITLTKNKWLSFITSFLVAISPMMLVQFSQISIHSIFAIFALCTLTYQIKFFQSNQIKYFYYYIIFLTFAFLTNEYALILLCVCLANFLIIKNDIIAYELKKIQLSPHIFVGLLLSLFIFLILWPAGILKLSVLKSYIFFSYFTLIKKPLAYGTSSAIHVWAGRFLRYPLECVMIVLGLGSVIYGLFIKKKGKKYIPFMIYALAMIGINTVNNADIYITPVYPILLFFSSLWIYSLVKRINMKRNKFLITASILIGLSIGNILSNPPNQKTDDRYLQKVITFLKENSFINTNILVSYGYLPILNYYLPDRNIETIYLEESQNEIVEKISSNQYEFFLFIGKLIDLENPPYSETLSHLYNKSFVVSTEMNRTIILFRKK